MCDGKNGFEKTKHIMTAQIAKQVYEQWLSKI